MITDLVEVTTTDGIQLSGAYFAAADTGQTHPVDAVMFFHGDSGNFYSRLYLSLGEWFAERGIAFLSGNRRGHDHVSNGARGGPLMGYAFESVRDSRTDYAAWVELLRERGHRRIAIGGHSGGAVRAAYAQASEHYDNVAAVVALSPGEYNHEGVVALHGEDFTKPFRDSERSVAQGRSHVLYRPGVPWGSTWSAGAYVDCFNPDNRYSVTAHAANTGCPTRFIFGGEECLVGGPQELPVCGAARRGLAAAGYAHVEVSEVEGANHGYQGRERALFEVMYGWLAGL